MNSAPLSRCLDDLTAFVAVLVAIVILIMVGHAGADLLTAVAAAFGSVYSLWSRSVAPHRVV